MSWQPYAGPITPTPETLPATSMRGTTPWPGTERRTAVRISAWDVPDFEGLALCTEADPELFFPDKGGPVKEAKKICKRCDVRAECLAWAMEHDEQIGVWGGLSAHERKWLRRRGVMDHGNAHGSTTDVNTQVSTAIRLAQGGVSADSFDVPAREGPGRSSNSAWPAPDSPGGTVT